MIQMLKYILLVACSVTLFAGGGAAVGACLSYALYSIELAVTGSWPQNATFLYGMIVAFAWVGVAWLLLAIIMDPKGFFALARPDRPAYQRPYLRA
jgi:hypothetical protein